MAPDIIRKQAKRTIEWGREDVTFYKYEISILKKNLETHTQQSPACYNRPCELCQLYKQAIAGFEAKLEAVRKEMANIIQGRR